MTKYAFNVFISIITQMFSFLANDEFKSRMSFDQIDFDENTVKEQVNRFRDREIMFIMKNVWKFAKEHMKKSQSHQITHVNAHRTFASDYQIDDQIWLLTRNIQIDRSSRKLDHKMMRLFKILKKKAARISSNFRKKWTFILYFTSHCFKKILKILCSIKSSYHFRR
jgi:hypothetical protein